MEQEFRVSVTSPSKNSKQRGKKLKMGKSKFNATKVGENDNARSRVVMLLQYSLGAKAIISSREIEQFLSQIWLVRVDERFSELCHWEKTANVYPN